MPTLFRSPTAPGTRPWNDGTNAGRLMRHIVPPDRGRHVLKESGTWRTVDEVTDTRASAAQAVLYGGHETFLDSTTADELAAAGYRLVLLEDDFSGQRQSMLTRTSPLGNVWHASALYDSVPSGAYIPLCEHGRMTIPVPPLIDDDPDLDVTAAGYPWAYLDRSPTRLYGEVVFSDAEPNYNGVALIASQVESDDPVDIALESVHIVLNPFGVGVFIFDNPTPPFTPDEQDIYPTPLACDGQTIHRFTLDWDGADTITVTVGDRDPVPWTDARISDLWGSTVMYEPLIFPQLADQALPSFDFVSATLEAV